MAFQRGTCIFERRLKLPSFSLSHLCSTQIKRFSPKRRNCFVFECQLVTTRDFSAPAHSELDLLLKVLPSSIHEKLQGHQTKHDLVEVVLDLGRLPEIRFPNGVAELAQQSVTQEDIEHVVSRIGPFGGDNRAGIESTLHRISCIRNRQGSIVGLTCRVGRAISGTTTLISDLVLSGKSILLLGRPGVGKTTAIREIARTLSDDLGKRVIIIDTSNEIGGDGDVPHSAIGRSRRMQVAAPEQQHKVMIEAVENHMPEVIVIDEIGTELEAQAARTIAERGVQLVGTAHGVSLENLIKNPTLSDLLGGIQSVTLGDDEARRRGSQKSILERKAPPTFDLTVEMQDRVKWLVHDNTAFTVDCLLQGIPPRVQVRSLNSDGSMDIRHETCAPIMLPGPSANGPSFPSSPQKRNNWADSSTPKSREVVGGRVIEDWDDGNGPVTEAERKLASQIYESSPQKAQRHIRRRKETEISVRLKAAESIVQLHAAPEERPQVRSPPKSWGAKDEPPKAQERVFVYASEVPQQLLDQVIAALQLPVVITRDVRRAEAIISQRSYARNNDKVRNAARSLNLPVYTIKSNAMSHIARALRRILSLDQDQDQRSNFDNDDEDQDDNDQDEDEDQLDKERGSGRDVPKKPSAPRRASLKGFATDEYEVEALEEARIAIERIVIPKGQMVELLPRTPEVVRLQQQLASQYRLRSSVVVSQTPPDMCVRILPPHSDI